MTNEAEEPKDPEELHGSKMEREQVGVAPEKALLPPSPDAQVENAGAERKEDDDLDHTVPQNDEITCGELDVTDGVCGIEHICCKKAEKHQQSVKVKVQKAEYLFKH